MIHSKANVGDEDTHQGAEKDVESVMPEVRKARGCDVGRDRDGEEW